MYGNLFNILFMVVRVARLVNRTVASSECTNLCCIINRLIITHSTGFPQLPTLMFPANNLWEVLNLSRHPQVKT